MVLSIIMQYIQINNKYNQFDLQIYIQLSIITVLYIYQPTRMDPSKQKQQLGISRSRFTDYLKCKGKRSYSQARKRFSKNSLRKTLDEDQMVQSTLLNYSTKTSQLQLSEVSQPSWMEDYRKCNFILSEIDGILDEIKDEKVKKMTAINQQKHNRVIEKLYGQAAAKVEQCQKNLKGIERGSEIGETAQQKKILANTLMSLAMKIREKAKQIRQAQQQDLSQRQSLKKFSTVNLQCSNLMNKDPEDADWLSEEGFQALEEQLSNERNEQILKIVSSIHSLNTIYKQLQDIVIQQGSLLDRIDENITTAAFNVKQANEHLTKAEQYQRSPLANRVIFVLVLLIVALTLILAFR